jgi:hypothetical protein
MRSYFTHSDYEVSFILGHNAMQYQGYLDMHCLSLRIQKAKQSNHQMSSLSLGCLKLRLYARPESQWKGHIRHHVLISHFFNIHLILMFHLLLGFLSKLIYIDLLISVRIFDIPLFMKLPSERVLILRP